MPGIANWIFVCWFYASGEVLEIVALKEREIFKMNIETTLITLVTSIPVNQFHATGLRGSLGNLNFLKNRPEFHHHFNNKLVYQHPKIQYRIFEGQFQIIGIEEGSYLLIAFPEIDRIKIYEQQYYVQTHKKSITETVGLSCDFHKYKIVIPWLPLNRENYREYKQLKNQKSKQNDLQGKFANNIISFSKAIKYEVPDDIIVRLNVYEYGRVYTNDIKTGLLGFLGTLETNFKLPHWGWGIGKWSARGYGIMKLMEE